MDAEVVSKLQSFNARRKLRAAAIASVLSSKVTLRTRKLKSLLGSHDLTQEELENLRLHFRRMWVFRLLEHYNNELEKAYVVNKESVQIQKTECSHVQMFERGERYTERVRASTESNENGFTYSSGSSRVWFIWQQPRWNRGHEGDSVWAIQSQKFARRWRSPTLLSGQLGLIFFFSLHLILIQGGR